MNTSGERLCSLQADRAESLLRVLSLIKIRNSRKKEMEKLMFTIQSISR